MSTYLAIMTLIATIAKFSMSKLKVTLRYTKSGHWYHWSCLATPVTLTIGLIMLIMNPF